MAPRTTERVSEKKLKLNTEPVFDDQVPAAERAMDRMRTLAPGSPRGAWKGGGYRRALASPDRLG
jgi:hypothetical protein